jgi:hypothetical protein
VHHSKIAMAMSLLAQERRIEVIDDDSGLLPIADELLHHGERRKGPMNETASLIGRLGSSAFRLSTVSVDVAREAALLSGIGTKGPSNMGSEDEVEQSRARPCRE